jgi:hypothetical protein
MLNKKVGTKEYICKNSICIKFKTIGNLSMVINFEQLSSLCEDLSPGNDVGSPRGLGDILTLG